MRFFAIGVKHPFDESTGSRKVTMILNFISGVFMKLARLTLCLVTICWIGTSSPFALAETNEFRGKTILIRGNFQDENNTSFGMDTRIKVSEDKIDMQIGTELFPIPIGGTAKKPYQFTTSCKNFTTHKETPTGVQHDDFTLTSEVSGNILSAAIKSDYHYTDKCVGRIGRNNRLFEMIFRIEKTSSDCQFKYVTNFKQSGTMVTEPKNEHHIINGRCEISAP